MRWARRCYYMAFSSAALVANRCLRNRGLIMAGLMRAECPGRSPPLCLDRWADWGVASIERAFCSSGLSEEGNRMDLDLLPADFKFMITACLMHMKSSLL
ncbi:hypothetical protein CEXT_238291 [Caerostris extrusa]|uniref:Uncharacterized protein n=1 Tax=Caerostris extrusa TaxID=172846 RepID=A0AAV4MWI1_CAEEX|nr:hypothetical protein CEXT_238291 [Caerostris extrusa]